MNTSINRTIDLMPYLSCPNTTKSKITFYRVMQVLGLLLESVISLGVGVCLITGLYVFFTII